MPSNSNRFNINECTHAIELFLKHTQILGFNKLAALTEIIFYYRNHQHQGIITRSPKMNVAMRIVEICNANDHTTRSNFLSALTTSCYKYALDRSIEEIIDEVNDVEIDEGLYYETFPAKIIAAFHHEALTNPDKPIELLVDLDNLSKLPSKHFSILSFCIKTYVPEISIQGNFVEGFRRRANLITLKNIVDCITTNTSFTYNNDCVGIMGPDELSVFLKSVGKASKLVITHAHLDKWTADDWKQFIDALNKNDLITSLNLNSNNLDLCCKDPEKFPYILKLFAIPQLKELFLHNNHLGSLPNSPHQKLHTAITKSNIDYIGLKHMSHNKKGSASSSGIFAATPSCSEVNIQEQKKDKDSQYPDLEDQLITRGC